MLKVEKEIYLTRNHKLLI